MHYCFIVLSGDILYIRDRVYGMWLCVAVVNLLYNIATTSTLGIFN